MCVARLNYHTHDWMGVRELVIIHFSVQFKDNVSTRIIAYCFSNEIIRVPSEGIQALQLDVVYCILSEYEQQQKNMVYTTSDEDNNNNIRSDIKSKHEAPI